MVAKETAGHHVSLHAPQDILQIHLIIVLLGHQV
jgi:hypothetical protein